MQATVQSINNDKLFIGATGKHVHGKYVHTYKGYSIWRLNRHEYRTEGYHPNSAIPVSIFTDTLRKAHKLIDKCVGYV